MAKKTQKRARRAKSGKNASRSPQPAQQSRLVRGVLDGRIRSHVRMLLDPCNAPLSPTAYRGSDGFVTRFNKVDSFTSANTAFVFAFYPAYNSIWQGTYADANVATGAAWATAGPGQPFLLANAESQRAVSACVRAEYVGTELNRQGILYYGVVPESSLAASSTLLLKQSLLQKAVRTPDGVLECKWVPSSSEEEYWATGSVAPDQNADRNVIVIIGSGFSAGVTFNFQATLIAEWRPKFGVGMMTPTPNTPDAPAGLERVRTFLSTLGNWWVEGAHTAATAMTVGKQVARASNALRTLALTM